MDWKYTSDVFDSVTLHDCRITRWIFGGDIICELDDGFDVFADCPQNDTGRHKRTGKAAMILQNADFLRGTLYVSDKDEKPLGKDDIAMLELEVLEEKRHTDSVFLACDAWKTKYGDCYCEIEFSCSGIIYCWNEFTEDAWFQDYDKK